MLAALRAEFARAATDVEELYVALYELSDPELIALLIAAGPRVHLILANGSFNPADPDPNKAAADALTAQGIDVRRRLVPSGHFAHNKFIVFADAGTSTRVWTGSTNWTPTGLCTQANHAVTITDAALAQTYKAYWDRLQGAGSGYPAALADADDTATTAGTPSTRAWFTPVHNHVDLSDARAIIDGAEQGALFLMFRPGNTGTLMDNIKGLHERGLFLRGVVNDDFLGVNTAPTLEFFNSQAESTRADPEIILPRHLRATTAGFDAEIGVRGVLIHSKIIIVDPLGSHPVIITGSHNLGQKASEMNDDNLLIIENQPGLASEFAVYVMNVYDHYKWRYELTRQTMPTGPNTPGPAPKPWQGLAQTDTWQTDTYLAAAAREASFWFGATSHP